MRRRGGEGGAELGAASALCCSRECKSTFCGHEGLRKRQLAGDSMQKNHQLQ